MPSSLLKTLTKNNWLTKPVSSMLPNFLKHKKRVPTLILGAPMPTQNLENRVLYVPFCHLSTALALLVVQVLLRFLICFVFVLVENDPAHFVGQVWCGNTVPSQP
jgi:hypothetical protein